MGCRHAEGVRACMAAMLVRVRIAPCAFHNALRVVVRLALARACMALQPAHTTHSSTRTCTTLRTHRWLWGCGEVLAALAAIAYAVAALGVGGVS